VWFHCLDRWKQEAGAAPAAASAVSSKGPLHSPRVILDPSKKPATLKWQRICIGRSLVALSMTRAPSFKRLSAAPLTP
jgi:hypothetical protein